MANFENNLAQRFNTGDEQAFAGIYNLYHRQLLFYASKFSLGVEAAEEIVSEAFVKLYQGRSAGKAFESLEHIRNFLYKVTHNAAITHLGYSQRQSTYMENYLTIASGQDAETEARNHCIEGELLQIIYDAVEGLPTECKRIFKLLYIEERNYQEVAHELGLSVQTVRNQKSRAIQLLRSRILKRSEPPAAAALLPAMAQVLACLAACLIDFSA